MVWFVARGYYPLWPLKYIHTLIHNPYIYIPNIVLNYYMLNTYISLTLYRFLYIHWYAYICYSM